MKTEAEKRAMKKWREENKDRIRETTRQYRKQHPEKVRKWQREKYLRHIEHYRKYFREWTQRRFEKSPWLRAYYSIKGRCDYRQYSHYYKRGIKNYMTKDDLKYLWFRDKAYLLKQPSIDRIDYNKNYVLDNCRYIELKINQKRKRSKRTIIQTQTVFYEQEKYKVTSIKKSKDKIYIEAIR